MLNVQSLNLHKYTVTFSFELLVKIIDKVSRKCIKQILNVAIGSVRLRVSFVFPVVHHVLQILIQVSKY